MDIEDFGSDDSCNGKCVECVDECFLNFYVVFLFVFIVEFVYVCDIGVFVIFM